MIRASGGPLAETGIMQGMSGSPATSTASWSGPVHRLPVEKEPIGGITPIGEMLDQLRDLPELPSSRTPLILPKMGPPTVLKSALSGTHDPHGRAAG